MHNVHYLSSKSQQIKLRYSIVLSDVYGGVNWNYGDSLMVTRQFIVRLLEYYQNKNYF